VALHRPAPAGSVSGRWPAALLAAAFFAVAPLTGGACGRPLTVSTAVTIEAPAPLTTVAPPFTLRWSGSPRPGHSYAVFIDRTPISPGHNLRDLANDQCKHIRGCPDASYLASRAVYLTNSTSVVIPVLPQVGGIEGRASHPVHAITLVALDSHHRRAGEASWTIELRG
jgi:hypothetical protein